MSTSTTAKIDWLTISRLGEVAYTKDVENFAEARIVATYICEQFGLNKAFLELRRSENFYPWVFENTFTGITIAVSTDLVKQGVRMVFPGAATQNAGEVQGWVEIARDRGWSFTRIDIAFDVSGEYLNFDELEGVLRLCYPGKKRTLGRISGAAGDTIYIGSRQSDNYCRIYDKAAQQKRALPWTRVELEVKGHTAKALGATAGKLVDAAASHFVAWLGEVPHWLIMDCRSWCVHDPHRIQPIREVQSDRAVWFNNTVQSAFLGWARTEPEQARMWLDKMSSMLDILNDIE